MRSFLLLLFTIALTNSIQPLPGNNYGLTKDIFTYDNGQQLFSLTYKPSCLTQDKRWLAPCEISVVQTDNTDTSITSTTYYKTDDYSDDDDTTVNIDVGFKIYGIGAKGSFSESHDIFSSKSVKSNSTLITSEITMSLYKIYTSDITMTFQPQVLKYFHFMTTALNNSDNKTYHYWLHRFAKSYGNAYISEVEIGGRLKQASFVKTDYVQTINRDTLRETASESVSFLSFSQSGSWSNTITKQEVQTFISQTSYVRTDAIGGTYFLGMNLTGWQQSVIDNPSVISYTLSPTSNFWDPMLLPDFDPDLVIQIASDYDALYALYEQENTHFGCTDPVADNFLMMANSDDNTCHYTASTGSAFGGYYVKSAPDGHGSGCQVPNPLPHIGTIPSNLGCSCPFGFLELSTPSCGGDSWCSNGILCLAPTQNSNIGLSFGGSFLLGNVMNNITSDYSCPSNGYLQIKTQTGSTMCIGKDVSTAGYNFGGGFFTDYSGVCYTGNPYANNLCACPDNSPYLTYPAVTTKSFQRTYYMYLCYGGAKWVSNNPGPPAVYVPL